MIIQLWIHLVRRLRIFRSALAHKKNPSCVLRIAGATLLWRPVPRQTVFRHKTAVSRCAFTTTVDCSASLRVSHKIRQAYHFRAIPVVVSVFARRNGGCAGHCCHSNALWAYIGFIPPLLRVNTTGSTPADFN